MVGEPTINGFLLGGNGVKAVNLAGLKSGEVMGLNEWARWFETTGGSGSPYLAAWYYACVQKIASTARAVPYSVMTLSGDEIDERDLPFEFRVPAGIGSLSDYIFLSSISLNRYGAAYWGKVLAGRRLARLRWLDASTISPYYGENGNGILYFERDIGRSRIRIEYDDDTGMSPDMGWVWLLDTPETGPGTAPEEVAKLPANILKEIDKYAESYFSRGAIGQHWVTAETQPPEAERQRILDKIRKVLFGGTRTAHNVEIFNAGLKVEKIGSDPKDLALTELDTSNMVDVAAVLQTPRLIVNPDSSANRAVMDRIWESWILYTIVPHTQQIVDGLNKHIFEPEGYTVELQPEGMAVMQEEEVLKAQAWATYVGAGVDPETAAYMLGIDIPEGMPFMAEKEEPAPTPPQLLPFTGQQPMMEQPEMMEGEDEMRAVEIARLRKYAAKGKTRPFVSDVLTPLEISLITAEVAKSQDAPFPDWESYP